MKKFESMIAMTAAVLAISAMTAPVSAFAVDHTAEQTYTYTDDSWAATYDDQTKQDSPSAKVNVTYENAPTYTVTIPADVAFSEDLADKSNSVSVDNVYLNKGKAVKVTVASANDYKMILDGTDATTFIPYTLTSNKATIADVITVASGTKQNPASDTATLTYTVTDKDVPAAGAYSDILTFTIAVVDAPAT